jgi:hypothetical protein
MSPVAATAPTKPVPWTYAFAVASVPPWPSFIASATYYAVRVVTDPEIPPNGGCYRPITVETPAGSIVDAAPPAAVVGGNLETSQRVTDVLLGALGEAAPERAVAAGQGTMNNVTVGGTDPRDGSPYTFYETQAGGFGASGGTDGADAVQCLVNFGPCRLVVRVDVQRVLELLWDDGVVEFVGEFERAVDGTTHSVLGWRVDHFGAERAHELLFLDAEALGDNEHRVDGELRGGDREPDPGVPGCRFDDRPAGFQVPVLEHLFEHVLPDAVLHARAGVERFEFRVHGHALGRRLHVHERRLTDGIDDGGEGFAVRGHRVTQSVPLVLCPSVRVARTWNHTGTSFTRALWTPRPLSIHNLFTTLDDSVTGSTIETSNSISFREYCRLRFLVHLAPFGFSNSRWEFLYGSEVASHPFVRFCTWVLDRILISTNVLPSIRLRGF